MAKKVLILAKDKTAQDIQEMLLKLPVSLEIAASSKEIKKKAKGASLVILDDDILRSGNSRLRSEICSHLRRVKIDFILISSRRNIPSVLEAKDLGAVDYITKPIHYRDFILRFNAALKKKSRIACIGGGTGLFNVLLSLKMLPGVLLTSIVSMSDDGGSSGRLRASFGILPPGDIRRSLVALSNAPAFMNDLMHYRFSKGWGLKGHNFGNLFLVALSEIRGTMSDAIKGVGDILNIQGIVLPVTTQLTTLCAEFEDGTVVKGESKIDLSEERRPELHIKRIWQEPSVACDADVFAAIINADFIIIGPGDLYTSLITNLLVKNVRKAISLSSAKKIYICNLMTEPGETTNYDATTHVKEIIKYLGRDLLNYVIISNTRVSPEAVRKYAFKNQTPVSVGDMQDLWETTKASIILSDVGDVSELVRHHDAKLRNEIDKIIASSKPVR
ncbi:MAG: uridine diphosphate-N-acetylglucosamine-binding protein YvcK [Candidatus Omnitrophica bacterium]|nr:uridine diphosphate-N-acetylglucosamine-binding protein YvcK [Candidatus Omnitrophota bacterium]